MIWLLYENLSSDRVYSQNILNHINFCESKLILQDLRFSKAEKKVAGSRNNELSARNTQLQVTEVQQAGGALTLISIRIL